MLECVKLLVGSEITVVVPPSSAQLKSPKAARMPRRRIIEDFCRVISETAPLESRFGPQRKSFIAKEQQHRTILQSDHPHLEFNARVTNYAERALLELHNPLKHDIARMLGTGNCGLNLELIGYGSAKKILLKLSDLPYVQIFQNRLPDEPFMDVAEEFPKNLTEESLCRRLSDDRTCV